MKPKIVRLNPPTLPNAGEMGYSQISIVEPGRMAYISGQVAWRTDGQAAPESLAEQMGIVADNAKAALTALGATPRQPPASTSISLPPSQGRALDAFRPACASWMPTGT